ncbi:MAG: ribonuclease HII [Robiginitomaculum sp.]
MRTPKPQKNKPNPDYSAERAFNGRVCGIDEAGRGPLAGPVVAAAVILQEGSIPAGLNDSKLLSPLARERLLNVIMEGAARGEIAIGIGIAEPEEIERINILAASLTAMQRAFHALPYLPVAALIDGNRAPSLPCETVTIIKGDSKSLSIAAASIVAKVTRDKLMEQADSRNPGYGFARHKGYPTAAHKRALQELGPCPIHRHTYVPVMEASLKRR